MIVERESMQPTIDLAGPDGNAFALMAHAKDWCKQLGKEFGPIQDEMMSGDYDNLLAVLEREFGDYVIFVKP